MSQGLVRNWGPFHARTKVLRNLPRKHHGDPHADTKTTAIHCNVYYGLFPEKPCKSWQRLCGYHYGRWDGRNLHSDEFGAHDAESFAHHGAIVGVNVEILGGQLVALIVASGVGVLLVELGNY